MRDQIDQQAAEMARDGREPAAIIMSPRQLMRFKNVLDLARGLSFVDDHTCSGYAYKGLTIYRSFEISGPCVVTADVLRVLLKAGRYSMGASASSLAETSALTDVNSDFEPVLF